MWMWRVTSAYSDESDCRAESSRWGNETKTEATKRATLSRRSNSRSESSSRCSSSAHAPVASISDKNRWMRAASSCAARSLTIEIGAAASGGSKSFT